MKKLNCLSLAIYCALIATSLSFSGCKKESSSANNLTADDAADAVAYATSGSTGGLSAQIASTASYSSSQGVYKTDNGNSVTLTCGVPFDTAIAYIYTGATAANYSSQWTYLLTCNGQVPQSLSLTGSYTGSYDAPRISSSNSGNRSWTLSGLNLNTSTPYTFNGTFTRTGTHTSKVRNRYTYTVDMTITVTNLTVSKTTYQITGGTGTVVMTGNVSNGNSYSFNGNIVFNGNGSATLTINGNTYSITL